MTKLQVALNDRFGDDKVSEILAFNGSFPLLMVDLENERNVTLIITNGLSDYRMPVPLKYEGYEHNELYFCLPSYWNWEDLEDKNANWVYPWIEKMANFVIEKQTWFGAGHTIPNGKEKAPISERMKQNHFLLSHPILLNKELEPIEIDGKTVNFLAIIPIFQDEMNYKEAKGTFKIIEEFIHAGVSEKVDDFRTSVLSSKWNLLRKINIFSKR